MLHILLSALSFTLIQPATEKQPAPAVTPAAERAKATAASGLPMPAELVDQERLVGTLRSLPTKRAARGDQAHRDGLVQTQDILVAQLKALGYEPKLDEIDAIGIRHDPAKPLYNIWVEIPGRGGIAPTKNKAGASKPSKDPKTENHPDAGAAVTPGSTNEPLPKCPSTLIVGAHFDAVPNSPGADDDGTGVAAIMEMARLLKDRPMRETVRLCLFNLEEVGLVGATVHAQHVKEQILDGTKCGVMGMIAMDMLGFYSTEPNSQKSPIPEMEGFKPPEVADFIGMATVFRHRKFSQSLAKAMRATSPGLKVVVVDFLPVAIPDILRSDHAPFLALGIPAVIVSDTAEFRSKHYHKPTDTIETLDLVRFTQTVKGLVGAVHELAGPVDESPATSKPSTAKPVTK
ncbi:MAG: M28 family peptidase [Pyrinomonadaceae bacterium]|nr:M28 family peptidase [Phycisphaerales bacterium]